MSNCEAFFALRSTETKWTSNTHNSNNSCYYADLYIAILEL